MLFALKHLLNVLLMPLPLALVLAGSGMTVKRTRHRMAGSIMLCSACILGFGSCLGPVANALLYSLEDRYPAVLTTTNLPTTPRYVVVLGSGYAPRSGLPITAAIDAEGVVRLVEGVRLFRQLPSSTLVLSGGAIGGHPPSAQGYAAGASALGIPTHSIQLIDTPVDTGAEIRALHDRVGDATILLVTSAVHMPRAMAYCARLGVHAIAAPTGQLAGQVSLRDPFTWLPSGAHLRMTESALHEYFGLLAMGLGAN
jgi:uncharacterized SAM-binding protein YcdF (DUF218 family)